MRRLPGGQVFVLCACHVASCCLTVCRGSCWSVTAGTSGEGGVKSNDSRGGCAGCALCRGLLDGRSHRYVRLLIINY